MPTVADFNLAWINSINEAYLMEDPDPTSQRTTFTVDVPKFDGTNWFDVRSKIHDLLSTRIGAAGISLTYLIRTTRLPWEDTEEIVSLQDRRIATKIHEGRSFQTDNREFHRILTNIYCQDQP